MWYTNPSNSDLRQSGSGSEEPDLAHRIRVGSQKGRFQIFVRENVNFRNRTFIFLRAWQSNSHKKPKTAILFNWGTRWKKNSARFARILSVAMHDSMSCSNIKSKSTTAKLNSIYYFLKMSLRNVIPFLLNILFNELMQVRHGGLQMRAIFMTLRVAKCMV